MPVAVYREFLMADGEQMAPLNVGSLRNLQIRHTPVAFRGQPGGLYQKRLHIQLLADLRAGCAQRLLRRTGRLDEHRRQARLGRILLVAPSPRMIAGYQDGGVLIQPQPLQLRNIAVDQVEAPLGGFLDGSRQSVAASR